MKKIAFLLPLVLAAGGCNGRGDSAAPNLEMMAQASAPVYSDHYDARPRQITLDSAMAHLPEVAGLPKLARDRHHPNGYWQEIILASDVASVESKIDIAIQYGAPLASFDKAPVWKPGEAGIHEELARFFPNMRMQVVANGGYENRYGRFGLALGRQGESLRCIFAWQYVEDAREAFTGGRRIQLVGATAAPAALRIRLCRADATIDDLVGYVRQLAVAIPEDFAAAQEIAAPAPRAAVAAQAPKRPRRRAHSVLARSWPASPQAAAQVAVAPGYAAAAPDPYAPGAGGLRYMAPVTVLAPSAGPAASAGLNPSLPPQAYRGPVAPNHQGAPAAPTQYPYQRSSRLPTDPTPTGAIDPKGRDKPQETVE